MNIYKQEAHFLLQVNFNAWNIQKYFKEVFWKRSPLQTFSIKILHKSNTLQFRFKRMRHILAFLKNSTHHLNIAFVFTDFSNEMRYLKFMLFACHSLLMKTKLPKFQLSDIPIGILFINLFSSISKYTSYYVNKYVIVRWKTFM